MMSRILPLAAFLLLAALLAVLGIYGGLKLFMPKNTLCWFRHKKEYGTRVIMYNRKGTAYNLHRWACQRCGKMSYGKDPSGAWSAKDGKLVADKSGWLGA